VADLVACIGPGSGGKVGCAGTEGIELGAEEFANLEYMDGGKKGASAEPHD